MTQKKFYVINSAIIVLTVIIIALLFSLDYISYKKLLTFYVAMGITLFNFVAAVISIKISNKKHHKSSINGYLLGILIRMPVFLGAILFSFVFLDINDISFIFSVLVFYIYFLIIEILFLNIG